MPSQIPCPCGGGNYQQCCQPIHNGDSAPTAEALMRSRYSAFTLGLDDYIKKSWHQSTCPDNTNFTDDSHQWLGLTIINTVKGQQGDHEGQVHFIARYKINGKAHRIDENSKFIYEQGHWYYLQATTN